MRDPCNEGTIQHLDSGGGYMNTGKKLYRNYNTHTSTSKTGEI